MPSIRYYVERLAPVPAWRRIVCFGRPLRGSAPPPPLDGLTHRRVTEYDEAAIDSLPNPFPSRKEIAEDLRGGGLLLIAELDGEYAGHGVAARGRVAFPYFDNELVLSEGTAYGRGTFIRPACRGRGLGRWINESVHAHLEREGFRFAVGVVEIHNVPQLLALSREGAVAYQVLAYRRWLLGRRYFFEHREYFAASAKAGHDPRDYWDCIAVRSGRIAAGGPAR